MQKLARTWRKSHEDGDVDGYSLPTRDDSRPIDTREQEELVRSLEKTQAQHSLLWRSVFAGLVLCYMVFLMYSIHQQAYSPWELRYHAYFMYEVDSGSILIAEGAAVLVCLMIVTGLVHNSRRHRLWLWCSLVPGMLLAVFWLHHMLRLAKFRWDITWLPLASLGGAGVSLYVDHLLNESSEEVRKLRGYICHCSLHPVSSCRSFSMHVEIVLQGICSNCVGQSNKHTLFLDAGPLLRARCSSRLYSHVTRVRSKNKQSQMEMNGFDAIGGGEMEDEDDVSWRGGGFGGREGEEKDYDRDPEFAEILGSCLDDPDKARAKMEERLRKKRNKILHTKTGSPDPMQVKFNKFDFTNSYIWLEFYNAPLEKDVSLICDTIRSWHIVGRLGGCNSMNMQLSQSPLDKRPTYDAIQGANVTPTTFYNIGDLEIQDNLARIWVDIGTSEPLLLDILINALTQISSDYVGIKQVIFGGSEFENWKENLKSEDAGYSIHKI
ncbi:hypothetical protein Sango_1953800 [Sesamum angolense]|uniref:Uncharacterized protein n=1 Tax=Sesamum angolense TaxID=2727404 RepID=A0AAE2BNF7_9LAMI|nr:hypothetical protein Sango_1953800 [Sesamum angolense]